MEERTREVTGSVKRYAKYFHITAEEMNEALEELGYQRRNPNAKSRKEDWIITEEGKKFGRMSKNPFCKAILWKMDAYFAVRNLIVKKKQEYMNCEDCGVFSKNSKELSDSCQKWICTRCINENSMV